VANLTHYDDEDDIDSPKMTKSLTLVGEGIILSAKRNTDCLTHFLLRCVFRLAVPTFSEIS
jgi:hypothetical protein